VKFLFKDIQAIFINCSFDKGTAKKKNHREKRCKNDNKVRRKIDVTHKKNEWQLPMGNF
jgi:hypothetical protein